MAPKSSKKSSSQPKNNSSPDYRSSPASDADIPPPDPSGTGPVYFFHDPATNWMSQWYLLDFKAPLPTRESIVAGLRSPTGPNTQWQIFDCNEQYMMYAKAVLFNDSDIAAQVLETKGNPRKVKALGRKVSNFDGALWENHREEIVEEGNFWKFTNGEGDDGQRVGKLLLETRDREIVEASPYDRIWGVGYAAKNAGKNRDKWGLNLLGKALVRVRTRIRESDERKGNERQE